MLNPNDIRLSVFLCNGDASIATNDPCLVQEGKPGKTGEKGARDKGKGRTSCVRLMLPPSLICSAALLTDEHIHGQNTGRFIIVLTT